MGSHEPIHSGHFMTSNPHTDPTPDDDDDNEVDVESLEVDDEKIPDTGKTKAELYADKPVTFYKFGPKKTQSIAIDVSLNKLNKCIKVAYNKMTTPKWKDFKGLRLHWKQRIRLNNVIWRAYYMEFRRPQDFQSRKLAEKKKYCYFSVPDDDNTHAKIEGTLIEGMYWKRRIAAVSAQYKRWRHFFKNRRPGAKRKRERSGAQRELLKGPPIGPMQRSQTPLALSDWDVDEFENIFTDELFASLSQPYMFPNPREMMQTGYADIVQPGLLSLQPSLEEIMSNLDGSELTAPNTNGGSAPPASISHERLMDTRHQLMNSRDSCPEHMQFNQFVVPAPPMSRDDNSLNGDYSIKDYAAASMLVDYSNQAVASQPTRLPSLITSQMLIMSGSISAQPQYSQAAQYSPHAAWKSLPPPPSPQIPNGFLVTGGDVAQVDYSSPFNGHAGPSRLNQPGPTPAQSMGGMPWSRSGPSSTSSWLEQHLTSPVPLQCPSPSLSSPSVLSPLPVPPSTLGLPPPLSPHSNMGSLLRNHQPQQLSQSFHGAHNQQRNDTRQLAIRPESEGAKPSLLVSPITQSVAGDRAGQRPMHMLSTKHETPTSPQIYHSLKPQLSVPSNWQSPSPSLSDELGSMSKNHPNDEKSWHLMMQGPGSSESSQSTEMTDLKDLKSSRDRKRPKKMEQADSTLHPSERKRILHLHAEQSRRCALKDGFDQLTELIPDLYSGGVKPTNAVVLAKAAEAIKTLHGLKESTSQQKASLQSRVEALHAKIAMLQSTLPSTSASSGTTNVEPTTQLIQYVDRYTAERSREQWQFWLLAKLLEPKLHSFASRIHQDSEDRNEVSHSAALWFCEEWKVPQLRPLASGLLVYLATNTSILTDPTALETHVREEINRP